MYIPIGSKNPVKIEGVRNALAHFSRYKAVNLIPGEGDSGVSEQPLTQEETIKGACARAKAVWKEGCAISIGLEDGLMQVSQAQTGAMNICVCSLYDGVTHHLGISSAFQFPQAVMDVIQKEGLNLSQAFRSAGLTEEENIGAKDGAIGVLTEGVLTRAGYVSQAVIAALAFLHAN